MRPQRASWVLAALAAAVVAPPVRAQSLPEALEAIQHARVVTRILYVTAHPDDEPGPVLAYLSRGLGADAALLAITRGEGGQNALGPEQNGQLGYLRTEELLAATRAYGARLYFTRAPDFGYSKTTEETFRIWGDTALEDMVRVIRAFRPEIVINSWGGVRGGHGHHQAAGILTPRAVAAAADSNAFPQQMAEGLKPWRVKLLLNLARGDTASSYRLPLEQVSPVWGKSFSDIGIEGFMNHRTQGVAAFLSSPFIRRSIALVAADGAKWNPAELSEPLSSLAARFSDLAPRLGPALERAEQSLDAARQSVQKLDWAEACRALASAGRRIAQLDQQIRGETGGEVTAAQWELARVRERVDAALAAAAALRIDALADRSDLVGGETFSVRAAVRRRGEVPGEFGKPSLVLPVGWSITKEESDSDGSGRFTVSVPQNAKSSVPSWPPDRNLPWPLPLVRVRVHAVVEGYEFDTEAPVIAQQATSTRVDTLPLRVVPAVTLALEPRQFIVVEGRPIKPLELLARVHYYGTSAAQFVVGLEVPPGWTAPRTVPLAFMGPGDQLARLVLEPAARVSAGNYMLRAYARRGEEVFRASLEPLPTRPTLLWSEPADVAVHAFAVSVPANLRVGYIAAENDPIPEALRQLGIQVELLDPVAMAFGDLGRFDAIAIGIRAYELRQDLAPANRRLLDYAAAGGTLLVQYQREFVWTALKPAPYPASVGSPTVRITDENSPVRFLLPDHPLLNFPNRVWQDDFKGWVQERGLYFWSQWDKNYQAVLAMRDPGEEEVSGGLLYARYGKGIYIYTGLAFFRQLPEGVPGAYRLFINLLSQSRYNSSAPRQ